MFRAELRRQDALGTHYGDDGEPPADATDIAKSTLARFVDAEPAITEAVGVETMMRGGRPHKLAYRQKTQDSFARKIDTKAKEFMLVNPDSDRQEVLQQKADKIRDVLRYTGLYDASTYWEDSDAVLNNLVDSGHKIIKDKGKGHVWPIEGYRGRNVQMEDPSGVPYELQFHTPETAETVELNHPLYEKQRLLEKEDEEWLALQKKMDANFAKTPVPPGTQWGPPKQV